MAENKNAKTPADGPDYERGFIDGMQKQMQSSVDRAVNAIAKREWVGLTVLEVYECWKTGDVVEAVEAKLKEKNHG